MHLYIKCKGSHTVDIIQTKSTDYVYSTQLRVAYRTKKCGRRCECWPRARTVVCRIPRPARLGCRAGPRWGMCWWASVCGIADDRREAQAVNGDQGLLSWLPSSAASATALLVPFCPFTKRLRPALIENVPFEPRLYSFPLQVPAWPAYIYWLCHRQFPPKVQGLVGVATILPGLQGRLSGLPGPPRTKAWPDPWDGGQEWRCEEGVMSFSPPSTYDHPWTGLDTYRSPRAV